MIEFNDIYQLAVLLCLGIIIGLKIYELKKRFTLPKTNYNIPINPNTPIVPPITTPFASGKM